MHRLILSCMVVAGIALNAAARTQDEGTAELREIVGDVQVQYADSGNWAAASESMALQAGDRVKTSAGAACDIAFADGTVLEVAEQTETAVQEDRPAGSEYARAVQVWFGTILAHIKKMQGQSARFEVRTPVAVCAVRGTEFAVEATADDATVGVFDGAVDVAGSEDAGHRATRITADQETAIRRGGRPVPPRVIGAGMAARRIRLAALRQRAQIVRDRWQNLTPDHRRALRQKALERRHNLRANNHARPAQQLRQDRRLRQHQQNKRIQRKKASAPGNGKITQ